MWEASWFFGSSGASLSKKQRARSWSIRRCCHCIAADSQFIRYQRRRRGVTGGQYTISMHPGDGHIWPFIVHCSLCSYYAFPLTPYSQTLENKSSLAAPSTAAAGLGAASEALVLGAGGAALLHPPNSSSALTFGAVSSADIPEVAMDPHPKSFTAVAGAGACVGATDPHTSFVPSASMLLPQFVVAAGAGCAFGGG